MVLQGRADLQANILNNQQAINFKVAEGAMEEQRLLLDAEYKTAELNKGLIASMATYWQQQAYNDRADYWQNAKFQQANMELILSQMFHDDEMEAAGGGDDGGTSFICGEIRRVGNITIRESMEMMVFLLKCTITHPFVTYWYTKNGRKIINEGNKQKFNWKSDKVKKAFVTNVIELSRCGKHEEAVFYYIENCVKLSKALNMKIDNIDIKHNSILSKIKGWFKLAIRKQTWEFGIPYLKKAIRYKYKKLKIV